MKNIILVDNLGNTKLWNSPVADDKAKIRAQEANKRFPECAVLVMDDVKEYMLDKDLRISFLEKQDVLQVIMKNRGGHEWILGFQRENEKKIQKTLGHNDRVIVEFSLYTQYEFSYEKVGTQFKGSITFP